MKLTLRRAALLAAGAAGLALTAACSGGGEDTPVETNVVNVGEPENLVPPVENIVAPPTPEATTNATPTPTETSAAFDDPAATQDYAESAGMTSRVDRSEEEEAQPAEKE